jgi:hypothetical protein
MTVRKPQPLVFSREFSPKKKSKKIKFKSGPPLHEDINLQSSDNRRRYKRRGSKTPAMLLVYHQIIRDVRGGQQEPLDESPFYDGKIVLNCCNNCGVYKSESVPPQSQNLHNSHSCSAPASEMHFSGKKDATEMNDHKCKMNIIAALRMKLEKTTLKNQPSKFRRRSSLDLLV